MKHLKNLIYLIVTTLLLSSCTSFGGGDKNGSDAQFLVLQTNNENKIANGASLSLMEVKKGEAKYTTLNAYYPHSDLRNNVDIAKQRVAMGLHRDFNNDGSSRRTNGGWFDIEAPTCEIPPLLPSGKGRYSYFDVSSAKVSDSGHIFYLSASNDADYYDQYRASLVRYNPATDKLETALNPDGFIISQPEKGWDTEASLFKSQFYPSADGRYVYGMLSAFGLDFGSYHYDYEILFKYDFDTETYTRLGDAEDKHVIILGATSDKNYVAYSTSVNKTYLRKIVNVSTNKTSTCTITGGQAYSNTSRWNKTGYCSGETNNTIGVYNLVSDTFTKINTPARPEYAQFSSGGDFLYFMIESATGKFLLKTSDLTETTKIDTVCTLQSSVYEYMVIK